MSDDAVMALVEEMQRAKYGEQWSAHPHEGPCTDECRQRVAECLGLLMDLREMEAMA